MTPQPYIDTEHNGELPVDVEGRALTPKAASCLLCGLEATSEEVWLKPAWWREAGPDGRTITTIPRCRQSDDCKARVLAAGESWPLLERGEQPGAKPAPADVQPKEAPDDDAWI
jgi:hypothetical protein